MLKKRCDWRMKRRTRKEREASFDARPAIPQAEILLQWEHLKGRKSSTFNTPEMADVPAPAWDGVLQRRAAQELSYHSSCCPVTDMCRNQKPAVPTARTWGNALTADVHLQTKQCDVVVGLHSQMGAPHKLWGKTHFELKNMTLVELHFPLDLNI